MGADFIIAPEAEFDLAEAYDWYEERRVGLGEEFLSCVDACIERICQMPEIYERVELDYRRAIVRRFPYVIFYRFEVNRVTIYGVFHTARDPAKWRKRLR